MVSKTWINWFLVVQRIYNMSFQYSPIKELILIVDKPDIMINIVSSPNYEIRILSLYYILQSPESSTHGDITSSVKPPVPCPCFSLHHTLFLSTTWRLRALPICSFQISSVHMGIWDLKHFDRIWVVLLWVLAVNLGCVFNHGLFKVLLIGSFKVNVVTECQLWADVVWIHGPFEQSLSHRDLLDHTTYAYESISWPQKTWSHTATEQIYFTPATIG